MELLPEVEVIIVPVGGGSGASGTCIAAKGVNPAVEVIGVQAEKAPAASLAWKGEDASGAKMETFLGLGGVGDLVTTCTSSLSRNHTLGETLGRGVPFETAIGQMTMVAEGVNTTRAAVQLAEKVGVEVPIARQIGRILFEGIAPAEALHELMTRPLRAE